MKSQGECVEWSNKLQENEMWLGIDFEWFWCSFVCFPNTQCAFIGQSRNSWWEPGENRSTGACVNLKHRKRKIKWRRLRESILIIFQPGLQSQNQIHRQKPSNTWKLQGLPGLHRLSERPSAVRYIGYILPTTNDTQSAQSTSDKMCEEGRQTQVLAPPVWGQIGTKTMTHTHTHFGHSPCSIDCNLGGASV